MEYNSLTSAFALANGNKIPCLGFGTWQSADGDEAYSAVLCALRNGYRHIDTATAYENEESVGKAINDFLRESGARREEIFVTTKLWNRDHEYDATKAAIELSLQKMGLDYLDLYLIHWPNPVKFRDHWQEANAGSWRAMEEAYEQGKLRALGLSNFRPHHIEALERTAKVAPMVNQIKVCPGQSQRELAEYSRKRGMVVEGYSPLGTGKIFSSEEMRRLSEKYGRSVAQICIRWSLQEGCVPLPKSVHERRIVENARVFDFELEKSDCDLIAGLTGLEITLNRNPDETPF